MLVYTFHIVRRAKVSDPGVLGAAKCVNGPLLEALAEKAGYHDAACINLFREGAPIVGKLARSGNGKPLDGEAAASIAVLKADRAKKNKELLGTLKRDKSACENDLMNASAEDVKLGRMAPLRLAHEVDLDNITVSPRDAIVQGGRYGLPFDCPTEAVARYRCERACISQSPPSGRPYQAE